jgi:acyl carrier protein
LDTSEKITSIVSEIGQFTPPSSGADLYESGFTSMGALQLLVELETAFDVTIPDDQFITARSVDDLRSLIERLQPVGAA